MTDQELVALVTLAKRELPYQFKAFEQLVTSQFPLVRSFAYGIVRDADLAGGVAQDVMLRVMHGLPKLESPEKFPAWSRQITLNVARSRLAHEKREQEKRQAFAREVEWEDDQALDDDNDTDFAQLIKPLNVDERALVSLKILEDLEFNEIAEILGISLSAAKMRYYRALDKIQAASGL